MKQCHTEKLKWQDDLADFFHHDWLKWVKMLQYLDKVQFPCYVSLNDTTTIVIFCYARDNGYGAVAYCHMRIAPKQWEAQSLCARARVAPSKRMLTIPKKELAACLALQNWDNSYMRN